MTDLKTSVDHLVRVLHQASAAGMRVNVSIDISPDRDLIPMASAVIGDPSVARSAVDNRIDLLNSTVSTLGGQISTIHTKLREAGIMPPDFTDGAPVEKLRPSGDQECRPEAAAAVGTISPFINGQKVIVKIGANRAAGLVTGVAHYLNRDDWQYLVEWTDATMRPVSNWYTAGELEAAGE